MQSVHQRGVGDRWVVSCGKQKARNRISEGGMVVERLCVLVKTISYPRDAKAQLLQTGRLPALIICHRG